MSGAGHCPDLEKKAAAKGNLVIKRPKEDEVFIDIDTQDQYLQFLMVRKFFYEHGYIRNTEDWPSPSGREGHRHIVVRWHRMLTEWERVALQSIFGSDPKREMLSWQGLEAGHQGVSVFFEKP